MKILAVDDQNEFLEVLEMVLTAQGHTVDTAFDGQKGWELAQKYTYDLAFFDHAMPELTGIELVKRIRANKIPMKIVMMSGYENMNEQFARTVGADEYLCKPFQVREIEEIIARYS